MKLLLIGSGGREHALAWKVAQSPLLEKLYCWPGNPGMARLGEKVVLQAGAHKSKEDFEKIAIFCQQENIDLVLIGPEEPLIHGLADYLRQQNIAVLGPSAKAAQLEGSKSFTKDLCQKFSIPTAAYACFTTKETAKAYAAQQNFPIVIKADGLAAGKGVTIAQTLAEAESAIEACFSGAFDKEGQKIVIEEFLEGEEISFFGLCDGQSLLNFGSAQDHKRLEENDKGPNTGGMGAYSPAAILTPALEQEIVTKIMQPTLDAMAQIGMPFQGILFAGLMQTKEGPKLIEYNVRFGDPETQVLMLRFKGDILPFFYKAALGDLHNMHTHWQQKYALTIVLAAAGYPYNPKKGGVIEGIEEAEKEESVKIFHAGTQEDKGQLRANGGRVLNVSACAENMQQAQEKAYSAIEKIQWEDAIFRKDIGNRALSAPPLV